MKIKNLLIASLLVAAVACTSNKTAGPIKVKVPARPAGQENVIGLTVPAMDTVRVGFVGLGMRGSGAVPRFTYIPGVKIVALCDVLPENVERSQKTLEERGFPRAAEYSGDTEAYKQLCERDDIDLVYICTDWVHHIPVALYAMEHGKNVACEVPSATSLDEIWSVIDMSEKTRKHFMMLENCCYDFFELSCLSMAQAGVFGEILHVEGSYLHNLDPFWDEYWNNWRLDFNICLLAGIVISADLFAQAQIYTRKEKLKDLTAKTTKVVLSGDEVFDEAFKESVSATWTISPFEFCSVQEFDKIKTSDKYYFLLVVKGQQRKESEPGIDLLTFVKGGDGASKSINDMMEVVTFPLRSAVDPSGREFILLPAFLTIIQDHAMTLMTSEVKAYTPLGATDSKKLGMRRIYFSKDDFAPQVDQKTIDSLDEDIIVEEDEGR